MQFHYQYQMDCLKSMCSRHLITTMSIETVALVLLIADKYHVRDLRAECVDYIANNASVVIATEQWKACIASRADLVGEVLARVANKRADYFNCLG